MEQAPPLLSDRMRPQKLDDLALPLGIIAQLKSMEASGHIMNMIFAGPPGTGKTTLTRILTNGIEADVSVFRASSKLTAKDIHEHTGGTLDGLPKVIWIEEAEVLSKNTQTELRGLIEERSTSCRFIFTTNSLKKIDRALCSRLFLIRFYLLPAERPPIIERIVARYETTLTSLGVVFEKDRLRELIAMGYPDWRDIANSIQFEMMYPPVPDTTETP